MSKLRRPSLPSDIDTDLCIAVVDNNIKSLAYGSAVPIKEAYVFNGSHQRTAKGDNLIVSVSTSSKRHLLRYSLKRDSLYHILPEYLFHPLDRYTDIDGDKEEFLKRRKAQKDTETDALEYFYPFDRYFQNLRSLFQHKLNNEILNHNLFIVDFITESYNINRDNRFINGAYPCIAWLRSHRGVLKMLEVVVRFAFDGSLNSYNVLRREVASVLDSDSCHCTLDGQIDNLFCGPEYFFLQEIITVEYQTTIVSESQIEHLNDDIVEFKAFFKSWFLNPGQDIEVTFGDFSKPPVMTGASADDDLFLGYNTQLI